MGKFRYIRINKYGKQMKYGQQMTSNSKLLNNLQHFIVRTNK
jgi:hypothetical protein